MALPNIAATTDTVPNNTIIKGGHISANISCIETAIMPPTC